jgi:nucleoid DNA-binding protein
MSKNVVTKNEQIKNIQIALESKYDKQVSMETIGNFIDAYEDVIKARLLKRERVLTGLGIYELKVLPPKKGGSIGTIEFAEVGERYKPVLNYNSTFRKEIKNLPVISE